MGENLFIRLGHAFHRRPPRRIPVPVPVPYPVPVFPRPPVVVVGPRPHYGGGGGGIGALALVGGAAAGGVMSLALGPDGAATSIGAGVLSALLGAATLRSARPLGLGLIGFGLGAAFGGLIQTARG